jgi:hypothetical protein
VPIEEAPMPSQIFTICRLTSFSGDKHGTAVDYISQSTCSDLGAYEIGRNPDVSSGARDPRR